MIPSRSSMIAYSLGLQTVRPMSTKVLGELTVDPETALNIQQQLLPLFSLGGLQACKKSLEGLKNELEADEKKVVHKARSWKNSLTHNQCLSLITDASSHYRLRQEDYDKQMSVIYDQIREVNTQLKLVEKEIAVTSKRD